MELTTDQKRALRAMCAWHLGDPQWASMFIRVIESDDPLDESEMEMDGETVDSILGNNRSYQEESKNASTTAP